MTRLKRTAQRGFTLMELLMTMSITTVGLIGLLSLHLGIARGNDGASREAEAMTIATGELELLRSKRPSDMMYLLTNNAAATPPIAPVSLNTVFGRTGMAYRTKVKVTPVASTNTWMVRVEVNWTEDTSGTGSGSGSAGSNLDHTIAVEVIRTNMEAL